MAAQVTQFVGAFTKVNLAATLSGWAGSIGAVANLKGALIGAMTSATAGLTSMDRHAGDHLVQPQGRSDALGSAIKGAAVTAFTALKAAVAGVGAHGSLLLLRWLPSLQPPPSLRSEQAWPRSSSRSSEHGRLQVRGRSTCRQAGNAQQLTKSTKDAAEGNAKAWKSWGDRLKSGGTLRPGPQVPHARLPGHQARPQRPRRSRQDQQEQAMIRAANDAYAKFQQGINQGNGSSSGTWTSSATAP